MTNPQLTKNLLEVIRSLPAEDRCWLLEQLGQDLGELSANELSAMALAGQAFDDPRNRISWLLGRQTDPDPLMVARCIQPIRICNHP